MNQISDVKVRTWTPAVPCKSPDNIVSSQFASMKVFVPSYERDRRPCIEQLLTNEYQRIWWQEKEMWDKRFGRKITTKKLLQRMIVKKKTPMVTAIVQDKLKRSKKLNKKDTKIERTIEKRKVPRIDQKIKKKEESTIEETTEKKKESNIEGVIAKKGELNIEEVTGKKEESTIEKATGKKEDSTIEKTTGKKEDSTLDETTGKKEDSTLEETTRKKEDLTIEGVNANKKESTMERTVIEESSIKDTIETECICEKAGETVERESREENRGCKTEDVTEKTA